MKTLFAPLFLAITLGICQAQEAGVINAMEVDKIREMAGQEVVIEGDVVSVGKTSSGGLTFINLGLPKKVGFVALVKQMNYRAFPKGF